MTQLEHWRAGVATSLSCVAKALYGRFHSQKTVYKVKSEEEKSSDQFQLVKIKIIVKISVGDVENPMKKKMLKGNDVNECFKRTR